MHMDDMSNSNVWHTLNGFDEGKMPKLILDIQCECIYRREVVMFIRRSEEINWNKVQNQHWMPE